MMMMLRSSAVSTYCRVTSPQQYAHGQIFRRSNRRWATPVPQAWKEKSKMSLLGEAHKLLGAQKEKLSFRKRMKSIVVNDDNLVKRIQNLGLGKGRRRGNERRRIHDIANPTSKVHPKVKNLFRYSLKPDTELRDPALPFPQLEPRLPEVAFAGRSNVGKSTLINSLTPSSCAIAKDCPGVTRTIQWFRLGRSFRVVDMPGYGFAYSKDQNVVKKFQLLTRKYACDRGPLLRKIYLLIDARHGLKLRDFLFLDELDKHGKAPYQIVLTKCDLVFSKDLAKRVLMVKKDLVGRRHAISDRVLMVSSQSVSGFDELRHDIGTTCMGAAFSGVKMKVIAGPTKSPLSIARSITKSLSNATDEKTKAEVTAAMTSAEEAHQSFKKTKRISKENPKAIARKLEIQQYRKNISNLLLLRKNQFKKQKQKKQKTTHF